MADRYRSILFLGAPGAGKGTQGTLLGSLPGFFHVSSGDMFRGLDPASDLGREIRGIMATGELVPDAKTVELWADHVGRLAERGAYRPDADLLLLDGIPRNLAQAGLMDDRIDVLAVIHLDARDRSVLAGRLAGRARKENRPDDARPEVVANRFDVYDRETAPLLSHYPAERVVRIEPVGLPLEVFSRIAAALAPIHARMS